MSEVDVFFVLSGFLITGMLLSQAMSSGRVSLADFYVRRARRILPAAVLTLVATSIAAHQLLNFVRAKDVVEDSIWASLFAANIHLHRRERLLREGPAPVADSAFLVALGRGQFYFVWPAVFSLVLFGALFGRSLRGRRSGARPPVGPRAVRRLLIVVLLVGAASLAWSIHSTDASASAAYFDARPRLGAGARRRARGRRFESDTNPGGPAGRHRLGLTAVVLAAVLYSAGTALPGYAALLPTVGTALVIAAGLGHDRSRLGVGRVLSLRPLRYVGDRSYAFYLWHWPVLIIAAQYAGHELAGNEAAAALRCVPPLHRQLRDRREPRCRSCAWPAPIGALSWPASAGAVLAVALVIFGSIDKTAGRIEAAAAAVRPLALVDTAEAANLTRVSSQPLPAVVAAVRAAEQEAPIPWPLTLPSATSAETSTASRGCTPRGGATRSRICRLGDASSSKTIVVIGDSHAQMWMPTVLRMALRDRWVVIPFVKVSCIPRSWIVSPRGCGAWFRESARVGFARMSPSSAAGPTPGRRVARSRPSAR